MTEANKVRGEDVKKSDIILIEKVKYLVCNTSKSKIFLLPIQPILDGETESNLIPQISIDRNQLREYTLSDKFDLFYLIGDKNSLVRSTLQCFFDNEKY